MRIIKQLDRELFQPLFDGDNIVSALIVDARLASCDFSGVEYDIDAFSDEEFSEEDVVFEGTCIQIMNGEVASTFPIFFPPGRTDDAYNRIERLKELGAPDVIIQAQRQLVAICSLVDTILKNEV